MAFEWPNPGQPKPTSVVVTAPKTWKDEALLVPHECIRWWNGQLSQVMAEFDPVARPTSAWKTKVLFDFLERYYVACIKMHHHSEEEIYNPAIVEKCKSKGVADPFAKIKTDHEKLIEQLNRLLSFRQPIEDGDQKAVDDMKVATKELVTFMEEHLAEEERDYPKIFDACGMTQDEEIALVNKILEKMGLDGNKRFLPPILYAMALWKGKEGMLEWYNLAVPPPIRMLNNNCWLNDFHENQLKVLEALKKEEEYEPQAPSCGVCAVM